MKKIIFKAFFMKIKHVKAMTICLLFLIAIPVFSYSQPPTKTVDFRSQITNVRQEYDAWCVYACLDARHAPQNQCDACNYYVNTYIVPYYNSNHNPYSKFLDDPTFNQTMADYVAKIASPCDSGVEYEHFGVLSNTLSDYFSDKISYIDFINGITSLFVHLGGPLFSISLDPLNGTGHCVLFVGSEVYDNDIYDPQSKVYIMDPDRGETITMNVDSFTDVYFDYYQ